MTYEDFLFNVLLPNIWICLFFVILSISATLLIYKNYILSIFDPLFFNSILSGAAYSVVFILYYFGYIEPSYLYHFLISQLAYFVGFLCFRPIKFNDSPFSNLGDLNITILTPRIKVLYILSGIIYVLANVFLYYYRGIPLFMPSRLEATKNIGFIASINTTCSTIIAAILVYKLIVRSKFSLFDKIIFIFFIVVSVLSGSKAVFLGIIFIAFYVALYLNRKLNIFISIRKINKKLFILFILILLFSASVILIRGENPISVILFRILMTGDIYMMAYVNENLSIIQGNFISAVLPHKIREIIGVEYAPPIGMQLYDFLYNADIIAGPNARHNVFGLVYLGPIFSIFFSFFLGLIASFIRNKSIYIFRRNMEGMILYILLVMQAFSFETDFPLTVFNYFSYFITFTPIYFISYVVSSVITYISQSNKIQKGVLHKYG